MVGSQFWLSVEELWQRSTRVVRKVMEAGSPRRFKKGPSSVGVARKLLKKIYDYYFGCTCAINYNPDVGLFEES